MRRVVIELAMDLGMVYDTHRGGRVGVRIIHNEEINGSKTIVCKEKRIFQCVCVGKYMCFGGTIF